MDLHLKRRAAIVTGASKGIGKAVARALAEEGVNLALLARTGAMLEAAAADIREACGTQVLALPTDIRDPDAVSRAVEHAAGAFGTLHILVNNAGGPI